MNIFQQILEEIGSYDGTAVIDRASEVRYQKLLLDVKALAALLEEHGVRKFDRVAILGNDSYEYIVLSLAVLMLDAAIIPVSSRSTLAEITALIDEIGVNHLLTSCEFSHPSDTPLNAKEILHDAYFYRKRSEALRPVVFEDEEHAAFIRFSSGTTGKNKGVVLSHKTVLERTAACTELGVRRGEHILWVLDMAYHFVVTILLFLRKGACLVICPRPVEESLASQVRKYPIGMLYATPYHYRFMTTSRELDRTVLKNVRRAFSTAMKLDASDAAAFRKKFGFALTQAYGIIEVGLPCINDSDDAQKADSVGRVQPAYSIELKNPDPESGAGEILIRGPGIFDAYLSPFRTRADVCENGAFNTGDVGKFDADGFLFLVGRTKNIINFSGMKIFPYEVESVLAEHPLVAETRVSGHPMPGYGEIPVAEVVFRQGHPIPASWQTDLRAYCYDRLAPYKVPKSFLAVDELPKTASGKLLRDTPKST